MAPQIATIGYQDVTLDQVIDSLVNAGVTVVVDTRDTPTSRRAEFRSKRLADAPAEKSIRYVGAPERSLH